MSLLRDNHVYSYSQLTTFDECPYAFYMDKIEREDQVSNIFAEQGSLIHDLIDKWAKGEIEVYELAEEYTRRYPLEVITPSPKMLAAKGYDEKTFMLGLDYFRNFDGFKGLKIIGTETKFKTEIAGRTFVGIVDMVCEDEKNGELIVLDHKSKSLSSFKKEADSMYRQQYLYSKYIYETYGRFPDRLMFNLFKEGGLKQERPFEEAVYFQTLEWAKDTIERIENYDVLDFISECKEQPRNKKGEEIADFFCTELCSVRKHCPNGVKKK